MFIGINHKNILRIFLGFVCLLGYINKGDSQNTDPQASPEVDAFTSFQKSISSEFEKFQAQNDSLFIEFLDKPWKEYNLQKEPVINRIKPKTQPRMDRNPISDSGIIENDEYIKKDKATELLQDSLSESNSGYPGKERFNFEFYGELNNLPLVDNTSVSEIDNSYIKRIFIQYRKDCWQDSISMKLRVIATEMRLNDFGTVLLTEKASRVIYKNINSRVLFIWFNLIKNGLNAKTGYTGDDIFLLLACDRAISNQGSTIIDGVKYYLYKLPEQRIPDHLTISPDPIPGNPSRIRMNIQSLPLLPSRPSIRSYVINNKIIIVNVNRFLTDYLLNFKVSELTYYFNAPVSETVFSSLDRVISPLLAGRTAVDKVNLLLHFIQTSFDYKDDLDQFGHEKYMFFDEAFFYPYTDCDDRAVLFSKMVMHYTDLEVVGLDYINHVSVGVKFNAPIEGDFVSFRDSRYYICDPTYIGAKAGMGIKEFKSQNPHIIPVSK
jgi:hypothetical protein